jgi:DNA-binding transcriptional LysR family regulator
MRVMLSHIICCSVVSSAFMVVGSVLELIRWSASLGTRLASGHGPQPMSNIMKRDTADLDLPLLRALRTLVQESSVTRAAQSLGIGQPAMSGQLARLRQIFGDPILTRSGGGSKPTLRALELVPAVDEILARVSLLASARHVASAPREMRLTVTIATTDYARRLLLDRVLPRVREEAPGLHLNFQRSDRERVREWMEQGSVDLGIGAATVPSGRLRSRRLYRDVLCCVAAPGVMPPELTLDAYCALPHVQIWPTRNREIESLIDARLEALGRRREVVLTVPDFVGVIDILRRVPLLAALPRGLLSRSDLALGLEVRSLPFTIADPQILLYWHDRTNQSAPHRWLREVIVSAFRSFTPE